MVNPFKALRVFNVSQRRLHEDTDQMLNADLKNREIRFKMIEYVLQEKQYTLLGSENRVQKGFDGFYVDFKHFILGF